MKIFVVNPGGTSTKIALFEGDTEVFGANIQHSPEEFSHCPTVLAQLPLRMEAIANCLLANKLHLDDIACAVGRGGLLKPLEGGTYFIDNALLTDLKNAIFGEHPSNLGPFIAKQVGDKYHKPAYIVDPVSVDEFWDIARYSGISDLQRPSWLHALNHKAVCREVAARMGGSYQDYNFIVAHLGSGLSIAAHCQGRMVDGTGGRSNGPFSPERCGGLPTYPLVQLCYSGKYNHAEMIHKISTSAGMYDYLGTKDMLEIEQRYQQGDAAVIPVLDAFIYAVSKEICQFGATFSGAVDRIILTGGIVYSKVIVPLIINRVQYLAPVECLPGEKEMNALAKGAVRVLTSVETAKHY